MNCRRVEPSFEGGGFFRYRLSAPFYHELGGDFFASRDNPERHRERLVSRLAKLGYEVDLTPTVAPA